MHGKEKDVLRQIQELFCLREFVVSSDLRSALTLQMIEMARSRLIFGTLQVWHCCGSLSRAPSKQGITVFVQGDSLF